MKTLRHLGLLIPMCLALTTSVRAGFTGLEAELVHTSDTLQTYRLYATFSSPSDELVALYGTQNHPWTFILQGASALHQSPFGAVLGSSVPADPEGLLPGLALDSWWTIGVENASEPSNIQQAGMGEAFAAFENGLGFEVNSQAGGGIFGIPGGTPSAVAGDNLRVLIGQVSLNGWAELTLNVQWRPAGGLMVHSMGEHLSIPLNVGCTDTLACNYNAASSVDDGSCIYGTEVDGLGLVYNCDGACFADTDGDGVCDVLEINGCTLPQASNFNPEATEDDGSCLAAGCTDPDADNFVAWATEDDGSCYVEGCTDPQALNHNPEASLNDGTCEYPAPSFEGLFAEPIASNSDGVHVHRLYASFTNPLDELIAVFGDASHPLTITSGTSFIQDSTATSPWEGNDDDSWLSLGGGGTEIQSLGMEVPLANFESGQDLLLQSAAGAMWFVYPGSGWGAPDSLGRVLLGQFTSDGLVSVSLNFQYQAQSGETVQVLDATASFPDLPAGCMLNEACNFDPSAIVEDGSCDFTGCVGCTDASACNFNLEATQDDGLCVFPEEGLDCSGICLVDSDGDGVCDDFEVDGCTTEEATNYNPVATEDDGTCVILGCTDDEALNFNSSANEDDNSCLFVGCMDDNALNFEAMANVEGPCEYADPGFAGLAWEAVGETADSISVYRVYAQFNNPNDEVVAVFGNAQHPLIVGATAPFVQTTEAGWLATLDAPEDSWLTLGMPSGAVQAIGAEAAGDAFEAGGDFVLNSTAGGMWFILPDDSTAAGTPDEEGLVLLGQLVTSGQVSIQLNLQYRAPDGTSIMLLDESLQFPEGHVGCSDVNACNYDASSTLEGPCDYPESWEDCDGECLEDADGDGVCDVLEVMGCTDPLACNWSAAATEDDSSCFYATAGTNCDGSCNLDTDGDGVCEENEIVGCMDPSACNYNPEATDEGYCDSIEAGYNCDGTCLSDSDDDGVCDAFEVLGCTSPLACNFMLAATEDDGSCFLAVSGFDCEGNCLYDQDGDGICDQDEITGCTNPNACNYVEEATDDATCYFPPLGFNCAGECVNDANNNGICDEVEASLPCMGADCCGDNSLWDPVSQTCIPEGPSLCGPNTVWDPVSQTCVGFVECPADLNANGFVDSSDLLLFLAAFGSVCD